MLNDRSLQTAVAREEGQAGWAAPSGQASGTWAPPVNDGPVSRWDGGIMTASGTASATLMLLLLLVASATYTWFTIGAPAADGTIAFPAGWVLGGVVVALVCALIGTFKPRAARIAGPVYALAEGVVVGAISRAYETAYDGVVMQAIGATLAVFVVVLLMYRSGVIKVTNKFRNVVFGAMGGLMLFYFVTMLVSLFGSTPSYMTSGSGLGILVSLVAAGLAAANLAIDFDTIDRGVQAKMPAYMEWYCALGVTVTLVWLYLEMLRLLAKLQDRR